jgi:hypothetical protein
MKTIKAFGVTRKTYRVIKGHFIDGKGNRISIKSELKRFQNSTHPVSIRKFKEYVSHGTKRPKSKILLDNGK